jgi:predicted Co/Zn/Cd cation transporter (cation efflux family)
MKNFANSLATLKSLDFGFIALYYNPLLLSSSAIYHIIVPLNKVSNYLKAAF